MYNPLTSRCLERIIQMKHLNMYTNVKHNCAFIKWIMYFKLLHHELSLESNKVWLKNLLEKNKPWIHYEWPKISSPKLCCVIEPTHLQDFIFFCINNHIIPIKYYCSLKLQHVVIIIYKYVTWVSLELVVLLPSPDSGCFGKRLFLLLQKRFVCL